MTSWILLQSSTHSVNKRKIYSHWLEKYFVKTTVSNSNCDEISRYYCDYTYGERRSEIFREMNLQYKSWFHGIFAKNNQEDHTLKITEIYSHTFLSNILWKQRFYYLMKLLSSELISRNIFSIGVFHNFHTEDQQCWKTRNSLSPKKYFVKSTL